MDATDHENIPSPGENSGFSSWMHVGFNYLKHEADQSKSAEISCYTTKNKSGEVVSVEKKQAIPELRVGQKQTAKALKYSNEDSGLESASSTNSSPSNSPQGSPSTKRKQEHAVLSSAAKVIPCYNNPITWMYKGLFSQESEFLNPSVNVACVHKDIPAGNKRNNSSVPADSGRRKYIITNFDINALSPQSW